MVKVEWLKQHKKWRMQDLPQSTVKWFGWKKDSLFLLVGNAGCKLEIQAKLLLHKEESLLMGEIGTIKHLYITMCELFQMKPLQMPSMWICCWIQSDTPAIKGLLHGGCGTASMRKTASSETRQTLALSHFIQGSGWILASENKSARSGVWKLYNLNNFKTKWLVFITYETCLDFKTTEQKLQLCSQI